MKYYCKHCGKLISPADLILGIGFTYHYRCYAAIYGNFND